MVSAPNGHNVHQSSWEAAAAGGQCLRCNIIMLINIITILIAPMDLHHYQVCYRETWSLVLCYHCHRHHDFLGAIRITVKREYCIPFDPHTTMFFSPKLIWHMVNHFLDPNRAAILTVVNPKLVGLPTAALSICAVLLADYFRSRAIHHSGENYCSN